MTTNSVLISAPSGAVWAAISDFSSHDEWMTDAESVVFDSTATSGVGTRLRVATRVGPLRTVDVLEVVEWREGRRIGVVHEGIVTGRGLFELAAMAGGTRLTWREKLTFPWWLGGPITAALARPVLGRIWRANLDRLKRRVEGGYSPTA